MTKFDDLLSRDTFDTQELVELIAELKSEDDPELVTDEEFAQELADAEAFASDLADYAADFEHGELVIADDYFTFYAQQLAEDLDLANLRDAFWPYNCIDWDTAAELLQQDYSLVKDRNGKGWWTR